ncbi:MAG: PAS domain S-box protein [Verrucomicrobia bacterium]|nr:PAS domain S-box protein [Prolixibacteraceae bacterium]
MLKSIYNSFAGHFHVEAKNDIFKIVGLHVFIIFGILTGLTMVIRDLAGLSADECLPGDISILIIFGLSYYGLRNIGISWAVNIFFMIPVIAYFFFTAPTHSILPNHLSVPQTLWTLIPFLLVFLLFSENSKKLSIFYLLSLVTLMIHVYLAGLTDQLFHLKWESGILFINPFVTLSAIYFAFLLIAWNFQTSLHELKDKKENTDRLINQTVRNLSEGIMLLEITKDEFGTPLQLIVRKTNPAFERLFKITSREIKDQHAEDVFPKIFRGAFDWNNQYFKAQKKHFSFYLEHLDKHYKVQTFKLSSNQLVSIFADVSTQLKMISELKESKQRFQVLLEAVPDLFFIIDKEGIYVDFVFKASEALKIKPEDIIGNSIFEVGFSERMSSKVFDCIQHCIASDSIETIEYSLEIEGATAMFEMRIAKLNNHSVISLARDITSRKIVEMQLEEAKTKAEESDRLKTAFLANISHEIRTPMNAIIGFSRMIGSPDFDEEEKAKFIDIIITNGKMLMELINDMISLSKIESNTVGIKKSMCRINDMMVSLYREFNNELEDKKDIRIKLACANTNPKFSFITDSALLLAILQKLIDNSIKFTEKGEVEFGYQFSEPSRINFFVKDTGIGIAQKDQQRIFERFHQLDNRTIRSYQGTGLGLPIAQHYVKLLGGSLMVDSNPGKGSVFSFSIPYDREESPLKIVR